MLLYSPLYRLYIEILLARASGCAAGGQLEALWRARLHAGLATGSTACGIGDAGSEFRVQSLFEQKNSKPTKLRVQSLFEQNNSKPTKLATRARWWA